ncbi:hypothetical protein C823_006593 [Eubacterium plexicaudatum ASF492]|nr:hypothetical protein C823_006593 [Eubacterium plexicaudatum ASF492]
MEQNLIDKRFFFFDNRKDLLSVFGQRDRLGAGVPGLISDNQFFFLQYFKYMDGACMFDAKMSGNTGKRVAFLRSLVQKGQYVILGDRESVFFQRQVKISGKLVMNFLK